VKPLNILALATWYPSKKDRFIGNFVKRHCEAIATVHNVWVIFVADIARKSEERIEKISNGSLTEIIIYRTKPANDVLGNFRNKRVVLQAIEDLDVNFDLLHAHFVFPFAPMFKYISQKMKIPWVFTEHWSGFHKRFRPNTKYIKWKWIMNAAKSASISFPVSENLKEAMKIEFPDQEMICIPNVVEDIFFETKRKELSSASNHFLHVSNLVEEFKNLRGTLQAFSLLQMEKLSFHLQIITDGDSSKVRKWVDELGLVSRVSFVGPFSSSEIATAMSCADALVLFSNTENQPCVVLESIAVGLPIIGSNVGDMKNLITQKRGFISPPGDVVRLAQNLKDFISTKHSFTADKVASGAAQEFSKEAIGLKYAQAYTGLLDL